MSNQTLIIGDDVNYGASKSNTSANSASTPNELRAGALGWFDASDNTLISSSTNPTDTPKIYLARGVSGGLPLRTQIIDRSEVTGWIGYGYDSGQAGRQFIGYDGSSSAGINLQDNTQYNLIVTHTSSKLYNKPFKQASTKSVSSANGFDIARDIAKQLNDPNQSASFPYATLDEGVENIVVADVLVETASSDLETSGNSDVTATVTHGSRVIELSASTAGGATDVSVGDTLRIGSKDTKTDPVYKVTEVASNNTTITLDRAYAGDDASGVDMGYISGSPADSDKAGLQLESEQPGLDFHPAFDGGFEGTVVSVDQRPVESVNSFEKIKNLEEYLQGKDGHYNKTWIPANFSSFVNTNTNYDVYQITLEPKDIKELSRVSEPATPVTIKIAVPNNSGTFTNSQFEVINNWFNSAPLNFANVTL